MSDTVREFMYSNPLHPDIFPDIRIMESEIISMVKKLFNGDNNNRGAQGVFICTSEVRRFDGCFWSI